MIYIELLILEDLIYNYLILLVTSIILSRTTSIKKLIIASLFGTISLFIYTYNIKIAIPLSITFSFIMVIIAFTYKDIIYTIKNIFYMYISSIFIAGFIYLLNTHIFFNINNSIFKILIFSFVSPIITYIYLKSIKKLKTIYSNYYKLDIYIDEKNVINVTGFLDTGNKLIDPYKQRPIILIKESLIKNYSKILLVPYKTISGESILKCVIPNKIYIHNIGYRHKFLLGLVNEINIEGANCILHQQLLERI